MNDLKQSLDDMPKLRRELKRKPTREVMTCARGKGWGHHSYNRRIKKVSDE